MRKSIRSILFRSFWSTPHDRIGPLKPRQLCFSQERYFQTNDRGYIYVYLLLSVTQPVWSYSMIVLNCIENGKVKKKKEKSNFSNLLTEGCNQYFFIYSMTPPKKAAHWCHIFSIIDSKLLCQFKSSYPFCLDAFTYGTIFIMIHKSKKIKRK